MAQGTGDVYTGHRASEIMAGKDLSNISRTDLKAKTDKLCDAGVINGEQRLDVTAPDADQFNAQRQSVSNPDENRNSLADLCASLEAAKRMRPDDTRSIAYLEKLNNLANSLAAVSGKA